MQYKNSFGAPQFIQETILDEKGQLIGTLRIKPSGVSWKPSNQHRFYTVSLDQFRAWITDPQTKATRTTS